jgi:transposase
MVADELEYVIGVDSHRERHAFAVVAANGVVVDERELPARLGGYRRALALAGERAAGRRVWAIEGTGSYAAGLARFLAARGERVLEVERPQRSGSRGRLKSDRLDALRAAQALLAGARLAEPRAAGEREALRVLLAAREGAVTVARAGRNQLRALVLTAPGQLRERLEGLSRQALVRACLRLRPGPAQQPEPRATGLALRACARRVEAARSQAAELERQLLTLVRSLAPHLLAEQGIGPISAAQILVSWSHPGRLRSEAAFARLAGAAPIPASSGKRVRHRLDRGGDRKLNRALHTIVLARRRRDPATIAYIQRRTQEGKSEPEAVRCLKRYLARTLYRLLENPPMTA